MKAPKIPYEKDKFIYQNRKIAVVLGDITEEKSDVIGFLFQHLKFHNDI